MTRFVPHKKSLTVEPKKKQDKPKAKCDFVTCRVCGSEAKIFDWNSNPISAMGLSSTPLRMALCPNMVCSAYRHPINPDQKIIGGVEDGTRN
jgi:hypothetical protein